MKFTRWTGTEVNIPQVFTATLIIIIIITTSSSRMKAQAQCLPPDNVPMPIFSCVFSQQSGEAGRQELGAHFKDKATETQKDDSPTCTKL